VNVGDALRSAEEQLRDRSESPRLDAEVLMGHVMGWTRALVAAAGSDPIEPGRATKFRGLVERRAAGEPVAYLTGVKEFWSLPLHVTPAVLIPRPETETLVEWALDQVVNTPSPRIADLGTGSGAIALALASERLDAKIVATDQSAEALRVAQQNARQLGIGNVQFLHGSWFEPLKGETFDLIVANPPYVAIDDPHLEALRHEPQGALVSGTDGLDDIRAIAHGAPRHLRSRGWLLLEHGAGQAEAVRMELADAGFASAVTIGDLGQHPRVTGGMVGGRD
jgi:release factor glutamine methyltransferase